VEAEVCVPSAEQLNLIPVMAEIVPQTQAISATKHSELNGCMGQLVGRGLLLPLQSTAVQTTWASTTEW
tara:strand:+ start:859 stop:1065 length:207 start_codon:yes stop_codon:yes gene_type:complete